MPSRKIVNVTKTEFTMEDGTVHPILFDLDGTPTIEEFQTQYDQWLDLFREKELIENERYETAVHR